MNEEPLIDLEVIQTNTKSWILVFPFDISGTVIYFTVKNKFSDPDSAAMISKTIDVPYNADSEAGKGYLNLESADTSIPIATYVYDIKFQRNQSGGGILQRVDIGKGIFRVNYTVTQRING